MSINLAFNGLTQTQLKNYGIDIDAPMSAPVFYEAAKMQEIAVENRIKKRLPLPIFQEVCNYLLPKVKKRYFKALSSKKTSVDAIFECYRRSYEPKKQINSKSPYELYSIACMRKIIATLISQQYKEEKDIPFERTKEFINLQIKMTQGGTLEDHFVEFLKLQKNKAIVFPPGNKFQSERFSDLVGLFCARYFPETEEEYEITRLHQIFETNVDTDLDKKYCWRRPKELFFEERKFLGLFEDPTQCDSYYFNTFFGGLFKIYRDLYKCVDEQTEDQEAMKNLLKLSDGNKLMILKEMFLSLYEKRLIKYDEVTTFFDNVLKIVNDPEQKKDLIWLKLEIYFRLIEIQLKQNNFALAFEGIVGHVYRSREGPDPSSNRLWKDLIAQSLLRCDWLLHLSSISDRPN